MSLTPKQLRTLRADAPSEAGNRLARATKLAGVRQVQLADDVGFSPQYVSDVVRGRYGNVTLENAHKFAAYFGCNIEDLFPMREERAS